MYLKKILEYGVETSNKSYHSSARSRILRAKLHNMLHFYCKLYNLFLKTWSAKHLVLSLDQDRIARKCFSLLPVNQYPWQLSLPKQLVSVGEKAPIETVGSFLLMKKESWWGGGRDCPWKRKELKERIKSSLCIIFVFLILLLTNSLSPLPQLVKDIFSSYLMCSLNLRADPQLGAGRVCALGPNGRGVPKSPPMRGKGKAEEKEGSLSVHCALFHSDQTASCLPPCLPLSSLWCITRQL